jgi:hypothetical protein
MDHFLYKCFKNLSKTVRGQNRLKDKDKITVLRISINLLYAMTMKMRIFSMRNLIDNSSSMNSQVV